MKEIVQACQFLLNNYPDAQVVQSYLDDRLSQDSQQQWGFGYFPDAAHLSSLIDLVGQDILLNNKLLSFWNMEDSCSPRIVIRDYFEHHNLILPFKDTYGETVALVGRTLLSETDRKANKIVKYKNTIFHKGNYLFGLFENKQDIINHSCVYIVEGQFDLIKAAQINFHHIVALGNSNMTAYQFALITRYTNNLFLLLDNDEAGLKGRERIIKKFGHLANIRNFYVPQEYKDVDEYIDQARITDFTEMSFVELG